MKQQEIDYKLWMEYIAECKRLGVTPTTRDFVIWLSETGEDVDEYIAT